ncbi:MAG: hypothetical protein HC769_10645 [Cyanobacteria bacterium CRU_2_1]|nr:hypothetical protein [Cyanobacteria bacterium RU_5_0]NJR59260.1 hypothetical protein [Cyanobacteria bacterium CRU_2_1]
MTNQHPNNQRNNQRDKQYQLGIPIAAFGWNRARAKLILWMFGLMLPLFLLASLFLVGIPALCIGLAWMYVAICRLRAGKVLFFYDYGIIDERKNIPQVIRYEEIQSLRMSIIQTRIILFWSITNHIYTVELKNGQKLKFTEHLQNIEHIGMLLQQQITDCKLPEAIANFNQGIPIEFGNIKLNQEGVSINQKTLPWSELERITFSRSRYGSQFTIQRRDTSKNNQLQDWSWFNPQTTPNLHLLFTMIQNIQPHVATPSI